MKQVSNAFQSLVPNPRFRLFIPQPRTFSKHLFVLLLAVITIVGSSFQKESRLISSPILLKNQVPFKGKFTLSIGENGVSGTGTGSHIGRFTLVAQDDESGFPYITGIVTITAANGDQIFATHTGFAQELGGGMLQVDFVNTITGGTGRFTGATGSFDIHAHVNENIGAGNATFDGSISN
jgi:hypothetical protein